MFYENKLKSKQLKYKLFNYENFQGGINVDLDENVIPFNQSKNSYNFCYKNGALTAGLGIKELQFTYDSENPDLLKTITMPEGVEALGLWTHNTYFSQLPTKKRCVLIYGSDNKMYYNMLHINSRDCLELLECDPMDDMPQIITYYINGEKAYLFVTKSKGLQVFYPELWKMENIENAPVINSFCLHDNRMFVTDQNQLNRVWYSDEEDPTNWQMGNEEAGYIEFHDERGNCLKVISFDDYVYVFREFGITRISSFKNQANIVTQNVFVSSSRIIPNTICVCGDKMLFMTTDGLYSFNGNSSSKVNLKIDTWLKAVNSYSTAQFFENSYYLTCNVNFKDENIVGCESGEYNNNALVKVDLLNNEVSILRGVDISFLNTLNDVGVNVLAVVLKDGESYKLGMVSDNCGKIFDGVTEKFWRSAPYDFGMLNKKKLVKKFYINSESDLTLTFVHDNKTTSFDISGSDEIICISPNISGYKIGIELMCYTENCNISSPQILVGYM